MDAPDKYAVTQYLRDLDTAARFWGGTAARKSGKVAEAGWRAQYGGLRTPYGGKDSRVRELLDAASDVNFRRGLTRKQRQMQLKSLDAMFGQIGAEYDARANERKRKLGLRTDTQPQKPTPSFVESIEDSPFGAETSSAFDNWQTPPVNPLTEYNRVGSNLTTSSVLNALFGESGGIGGIG